MTNFKFESGMNRENVKILDNSEFRALYAHSCGSLEFASEGAFFAEGGGKVRRGFTMVELLLVITLLSFIFGMGAKALAGFSENHNLRVTGEKLVQTIREARVNAVAQQRDSAWGVYLDDSVKPEKYVLYKGGSYATRDPSFDRVTELTRKVVFRNIELNGGKSEIAFGKRSGFTSEHGSFQLVAGDNFYSIAVNALGFADYVY